MYDYESLLREKSKHWWSTYPPADLAQVQLVIDWFNGRLPSEYTDFFYFSNGAYAEFPVEPWCCELFKIEELIQANLEYGILEVYPNNIAIGSSGGGEILVLRVGILPNKIEALSAIYNRDGTDEFLFIANSFLEFSQMLGEKGEEDEDSMES